MAFEFLGLLEFALVNSFVRKAAKFEKLAVGTRKKMKEFSHETTSFHLNRKSMPEKIQTNKMKMDKMKATFDEDLDDSEERRNSTTNFYELMKKTSSNRAKTFDFFSRIFFPLCFLLFNLFFWLFYS